MIISDLYETIIECSTYNTNIGDDTVTVTVTLKDFNKNNVTGKSVTLSVDKGYFNKNGTTTISNTTTKSITATTNSNGQITATWTASEGGLATFTANNTKIQVNVNLIMCKLITDVTGTCAADESVKRTFNVPSCPDGFQRVLLVLKCNYGNIANYSFNDDTNIMSVNIANHASSSHGITWHALLVYFHPSLLMGT